MSREQKAIELLREHRRPVLAMRRAYHEQRFGLVLGAGVSRAFDFSVPSWEELLEALAGHQAVDGTGVDHAGGTPGARADVLFQHYSRRRKAELVKEYEAAGYEGPQALERAERRIRGEWHQIIRDVLYASAPKANQLAAAHPYLLSYLDVVVNSPLTISYNFDSYLEMMLARRGKADVDPRGRDFETVVDGAVPFRSTKGVIYHPNGFLPRNVLDRASDQLVFSEEEFGDQLISAVSGRYSALAYHFSKRICLFIGLSLADENLRYFLRRNASTNPGHFHYFVDFQREGAETPEERRRALFEYRFSAYNLISLFLTNDQIDSLGHLLSASGRDFAELCEAAGVPPKEIFYLTGIPGIGKTTVLRHLASLGVYDEWMDEPPDLLAKPHKDLTEREATELDNWIANQFSEKNRALAAESEGIFVVERAPLDPVCFVDVEKIPEKARIFAGKILPTGKYGALPDGHLIVLNGDPATVSARIAGRQVTPQDDEYLAGLQRRIRDHVYSLDGSVRMYSTDWSVPQLVKEIARQVHLGDSRPVDLRGRLQELCNG